MLPSIREYDVVMERDSLITIVLRGSGYRQTADRYRIISHDRAL